MNERNDSFGVGFFSSLGAELAPVFSIDRNHEIVSV